MNVHVCDAICGAGKTESCIRMINSSKDKKFIFITPYLDEVERIKSSCASRNFVSPEKKFTNKYSKLQDLHSLLRAGENIASTHALFAHYTDETRQLIKDQHYTLILDEVLGLFQPVNLDGGDIKFLLRNNIVRKENDNIVWDDSEYNGIFFNEFVQMAKSQNLVDYDGSFFFWAIPIDIFNMFSEAYVLTYLFEYQLLRYYFDVNNISYHLIGTTCRNGVYSFCDISEMDRSNNLKDKIKILDDAKFNRVGNETYALSAGWFDRAFQDPEQEGIKTLKNNLYNFFRKTKSAGNDKMWTTFNRYRGVLRGKGYSNGFITFNKRATNEFANKHYLAYCVNVFLQPWVKNYLTKIGAANVNQDMYALSVLIQWVFRSAIRKGENIEIYIPSRRMRFLFRTWLDNLAEGKDLKEINYNSRRMQKSFQCPAARTKRRKES